NAIVVLVYDDEYLRAAGTQWGFSPNEYKPLFTRLAEAGALAVFFDIQFLGGDASRNASIASLYRHANSLESEHGTKFVFAEVLANPAPEFEGVRANDYALAEMLTANEEYALHPGRPTAALKLYQLWCEPRSRDEKPSCDANSLFTDSAPSLFVEWG